MAKVHSSLATTELHNPKGIGVESATEELLTMSASLGAVSASASIVPHTTDVFSLGTDSLRWTNVIASGNVSSSLVSTGSFGRLELAGNADIDGTLTIAGGTTTLGDSASDTVVISADLASNLIPDADGTRDIGSSAASWRNIHLDGTGSFKNTIIENREYFSDAGGEYISGDGTDMTLNSGADINLTATADVNIPSGVGVTFGNDGEKIEGDGTDLTIASSAKLNLTATSDVHVPKNVGIVFDDNASEKIESNDTDLTINSGADINLTATSDVNIPANVGVTFGDDGEKIEGDGTDLTITGNNINLTGTADIKVPANVGVMFGTHEKIESDDTDLSITVGSGGDINIPANIGLTFGDDGEKIEGDGTNMTISANKILINSAETSGSSTSTGSFAHGHFASKVGINEVAPAEALEVVGNVSGSGTGSFHHGLVRQYSYLFDEGGEYLLGDGTDLTIASGQDLNLTATTDINIPSGVGLTFGDDGEKIEGDGTDLTIAGNNINLTAVADVKVPVNVGVMFGTHEKIESDDTDLNISVGANGDINIPADIGLTFGDDGEKIEGDGTDLTIASSNDLNLTATTDINIPANVGLTFGDDGEKIEGDGTDLTIAGNNINLTGTADIKVPANVGVMFGTHEKIESDDTDLTITVGSGGDINVGANIGMTFGNDGEKIEGDGTDLTVASSAKLNLTATSDVHIPKNVGIVFDDDASEKIESNDTDLTINSGADINLTATSDINIPAEVGLTFGADTEKIEVDGSNNLSIISNGNTLIETVTFNNGNVTIPGDLTVTGDRLEAQVGSLQVADHTITVGSGSATSALMHNGGVDWGISGSVAFLRYRHAGTALSSSVFMEAPKITVDTITLDAAEIDASGALTIDTGADLTLDATGDVNIPADIGLTFGDDGEKIEGDGTDLTIASSAKLNLTATSDVHIPQNVGLVFDANASEKIESNDTDLTINSGADINLTATTDINIPSDVGLTFGDDAEKIEGDGTDLTITGNKINLSPTADVHIPKNKGIVFDDNASEKIESNDTDLTINSGADINLTATADVNIPANVGITFGDDAEKIEGDGTDLTISANILKIASGMTSGSSVSSGSFAHGHFHEVGINTKNPAEALHVIGNVSGSGTGSFHHTLTRQYSYLFDEGGEYLTSDGTDLTIASGQDINLTATTDINIPANVGLTFGNDGEKIEGDGTDLTIAGNNINLTGTADIKVPANVGVMFGTHEKIESDDTDLSITVGSGGDINIPANIGLTFGDDGEKIEGDGTDLTISANKIKIDSALVSGSSTSTGSFANVFVANRLSFNDHSGNSTGEYLESDGTDLNINVGGSGDINVPANIGMTFGNDGEKIEGDGTDLTIASSNLLNLTATTDIVIPTNVGLHFTDANEKIESDGTDLTINSGGKINLTATSDVHIPNDVGIVFGGASEKIEGDGTDLVISANNLTVDAAADIILDAAGNDTIIKSAGTAILTVTNSSSDAVLHSNVNNKSMIFKGEDGGSTITALTLSMADAGLANFNNDVVAFYSSDERLKDNIIKIGDPLMKLSELRGVEFDWNDNKEAYAGEHSYGVIAQEVEKVLPEIVTERSDGYKAVKYELIVPLLIESIKELHKKVEHIEKNCECLDK